MGERWARAALALLMVLPTGCTAMRPLPRSEYAAVEERRDVVVETVEGERVEFESIRVAGDTLTGWREREAPPELPPAGDGEPPPAPPPALPEQRQIPLDAVAQLSVKRVDWYRTGLLVGGVVAAFLGYVLTRGGDDESGPPDDPDKPPPTLGRR